MSEMAGFDTKKWFKTLASAEVDGADMMRVADKGILDLGSSGEGDMLLVGFDGNGFPEKEVKRAWKVLETAAHWTRSCGAR